MKNNKRKAPTKTVRTKVVPTHPELVDPRCSDYILANNLYKPSGKIIILRRIREPYGHTLNMSSEFPMKVNGVVIRNVEQLYQCIRYPFHIDVQDRIIGYASPLIAKRYSLQFRDEGRADWYQMKTFIMKWCLQVKLACNYDGFGKLLDSTGQKILIETSPDGNFWGAVPAKKKDPKSVLRGANVFGQLLMELRDQYRRKPREEMLLVKPLDIPDFLLLGEQIRTVDFR